MTLAKKACKDYRIPLLAVLIFVIMSLVNKNFFTPYNIFTSASDGAGVGGDFNGAVCSIIGGNALYGGHGGMVQVFIGTVTFGLISNILQLFGLSTAVQYIVQGAILLLAINLDNLKKR